MEGDYVTLRVFNQDYETLLLEPLLKAEEINFFLKDQQTVAIDPLISQAIGGIKLQVHKNDVERALKVLEHFDSAGETEDRKTFVIVNGKELERILEECIFCSSEDVFKEPYSFIKGLFKPFEKKLLYCDSCKREWNE